MGVNGVVYSYMHDAIIRTDTDDIPGGIEAYLLRYPNDARQVLRLAAAIVDHFESRGFDA